jgi:AcrR family transcriptional regulator
MVSSGIYRYFPSRDQLLTALIIDAYDAVGAATEAADAACKRTNFTDRWRAACHAVRDWALEHPHEYALAYGSPVPGYSAPEDTVGPASRVTQVVAAVVREAAASGALRDPFAPERTPALSNTTALEAAVAAVALPDVPVDAVVRTLTAWTQLFGFVSFEVFGRFVGVVEDCDALFEQAVTDVGAFIGFTSPAPDPAAARAHR